MVWATRRAKKKYAEQIRADEQTKIKLNVLIHEDFNTRPAAYRNNISNVKKNHDETFQYCRLVVRMHKCVLMILFFIQLVRPTDVHRFWYCRKKCVSHVQATFRGLMRCKMHFYLFIYFLINWRTVKNHLIEARTFLAIHSTSKDSYGEQTNARTYTEKLTDSDTQNKIEWRSSTNKKKKRR